MSAGVGYTLGPLTPDQIDFMHAAPLSALVAAVNGSVDLNRLAHQELANRGCECRGTWIGFREARTAYLASLQVGPHTEPEVEPFAALQTTTFISPME